MEAFHSARLLHENAGQLLYTKIDAKNTRPLFILAEGYWEDKIRLIESFTKFDNRMTQIN